MAAQSDDPVLRERRLRVLLLIGKLGPAGAEAQLVQLAIGLAQRGAAVTLACITKATIDLDPLRSAGVRVLTLGAGRRTRFLVIPTLVRLAHRADVVQCTLWDASLWGRLAAMIARRPVIVSEHSLDRKLHGISSTGVPRGRWIALHNRLLDRFTYATVACAESQFGLLAAEGVAPEKTLYIPNGLPIEAVTTAAQAGVTHADLGISPDARVVIQVARFQPVKNQRLALETVAQLRERLGDVQLLFVGDGRDRADVESQAAAIGADWAHFLGRRQDVPALLALSDLVILPSLAEAMPISLIEAMAVGKPIVATDVGDVRPLLDRSRAGICVPAGDAEAFRAACLEVLSDGKLAQRLAANGRAASRDFDSELMVDRYWGLFEAAVAGLSPTAAQNGAPPAARAGSGDTPPT